MLAAACLALVSCRGEPAPEKPASAKRAAAKPIDAGTPAAVRDLPYGVYGGEAEALVAILEKTQPGVVGFGEMHQLTGTSSTLSAIERFTRNMLPVLAGRASDLIVETWVSMGRCGTVEKRVVAEVDEVSDRPAETSNETIRLLKAAKALGVQPHILGVDCKEYEKVLAPDGGLDYFAFLELVGRILGDRATEIAGKRPAAPDKPSMLVLYSGAVHNDVAPRPGFEPVSFAARVDALGRGRYVEIDLLVPEFVEQSTLAREEPWFAQFEKLASKDRVVVLERAPDAYSIIFRRSVAGLTPRETPRPAGR
ncbi:MAG: hypothetical protein PHU25_03930 [Deltaproteobacteria bacterium]|nr:hypothetical protein [Deltaproteobacteria bacterium]